MLAVDVDLQPLVERARAGEPDAWDGLFRRYQLPLYAYVYELVRQEQEGRRHDRAEIDDEHDEVFDLVARVQFLERVNQGGTNQRRVIGCSFVAHNFIFWRDELHESQI